jgi:hypothetical protein
MANVLTQNIWTCASLGILSTKPVLVKAIMYYPAAVDGEFTLKWWDEVEPPTLRSNVVTTTITTSTDNTITASGGTPFPNTWLDGNVIKCTKSSNYNHGVYGLVQTAGNDTVLVTWGAPFTNDAAAVGNWDCYPTYTAFRGKASKAADTETSMWFPFGGEGMWFPNLALDDFDTSDVVIIYVG